jgi:hypothetical protein
LLFIAVDRGPQHIVFAGPVLSHTELESVGPPRRLSDDEWKGALANQPPTDVQFRPELRPVHRPPGWPFGGWFPNPSSAPPPPPWTRSYLVPAN